MEHWAGNRPARDLEISAVKPVKIDRIRKLRVANLNKYR
jgi:hypothetical protein